MNNDEWIGPLDVRLDRIMALSASADPDTLRAVIRQEIIDAIREAGDIWHKKALRHQAREAKQQAAVAITEKIEQLFQERRAIEKQLGTGQPPLGARYYEWRVQAIARLHTNETEYRYLKQLRHQLLKDDGH